MAFGIAGLAHRSTRCPPTSAPSTVEHLAEERRVRRLHFDEQHARVRRQVMRLLRVAQLARVLVGQPRVRPVRDDADRHVRRLAEELSAAIGSAVTPCTRSSVDRSTREMSEVTMIVTMNQVAILHAVGPLDDVGDRRVDEDQRDDGERRSSCAAVCVAAPSVTATAADVISTSTPVAYAPPCASTSALKMIVMRNVMPVNSVDERPRRARPFGRHAVPRQVARHEVQQARHRRRAGEPQDGDRADVVDGAEHLAEVVVRQIRERAPRRLAALRETLRAESAASSRASCRSAARS